MAKEEMEEKMYDMNVFISDEEYSEDMQAVFESIEPLNEDLEDEEKSDEGKSDSKKTKENSADPNVEGENVGEDDEETPPKKPEEDSSSTVSADKLYSSFAKSLKERGGVFSHLDLEEGKEVKSFDDLKDLMEQAIQKNIDNSLDDFQKEFKEALNIGMPTDEFKQLQNAISQLDGIPEDVLTGEEEDSINFRYNIIKKNAVLQGIREDKAEKLAKVAMKDGSDVEEAKAALAEMREHYQELYKSKKKEYQEQTKKQEEEQKNAAGKYEEKVKALDKIGDFELTDSIKDKIVINTTKIVGRKDGRPLNALMKARLDSPDEFDIKLNWLWVTTEGFKDFSYFTGKGRKEATTEFDKLLKQSSSSDFNFNNSSSESSIINLDEIDENESVF